LGREALEPFLARKDKGSIILCRTSNPGAGELQDLRSEGKPLWLTVAERVVGLWNSNGNCGLVVGATYPEELKTVRDVVGQMLLLVPGIGAQGGDLNEVMKVGLNKHGGGLIIHASRSIIFAQDPAKEAESLCNNVNTLRN
jgi:orotidine-5'-phosphate decarboxylase